MSYIGVGHPVRGRHEHDRLAGGDPPQGEVSRPADVLQPQVEGVRLEDSGRDALGAEAEMQQAGSVRGRQAIERFADRRSQEVISRYGEVSCSGRDASGPDVQHRLAGRQRSVCDAGVEIQIQAPSFVPHRHVHMPGAEVRGVVVASGEVDRHGG
jgi:hypothetical protein